MLVECVVLVSILGQGIMYHYSSSSRRPPNVPLEAPSWTSGYRILVVFEDIDTERSYTFFAGRSHIPSPSFYHLPFVPALLTGSEISQNSTLIRNLSSSDDSPSSRHSGPWTNLSGVSPMGDYPTFLSTEPGSSTSSRSGRSNVIPTSYFPPSFNMATPYTYGDPGQNNLAPSTFAPTPTSSYPNQRAICTTDFRDGVVPESFYHQQVLERHQDHPSLSSDLLQSPNWSTATNDIGSGRSLSASQLENTNSYTSEHSDRDSSSYGETRNADLYRGHAGNDADDEDSDTMSDDIASDETVYSLSGSDRDVFDDEDDDSFEVTDSVEMYDSDE